MSSNNTGKSENPRFRSLSQWLEYYGLNDPEAQDAGDPRALGERLANEAVDRLLQQREARKQS